MGGRSSAPRPPDPQVTAQAQTGTNVSTAVANQILGQTNQVTPFGNLTYQQTGTYDWTDTSGKNPVTYTLPTYTATQTLSENQQRISDAQEGASLNLANLGRDQSAKLGSILGTSMNFSRAPGVTAPRFQRVGDAPSQPTTFGRGGQVKSKIASGGSINTGQGINAPKLGTQIANAGDITRTYGTDFEAGRQRVEDALMERQRAGLDQGRSRMESQLANQGIKIGTEAYDRAVRNYDQRENDARLGAILAGGQEQSRLAGLDADRAAFQNAAQAQQFGQNVTSADFRNAALQQGFGNDLGLMQAQNQAQQQQFGQNQAQAAFGNAAQQQRFGQNQQVAQFGQQARQLNFQNDLASAGFNNQWGQQAFGNQQDMRSNWLNEQYAKRNQPINEIAALLGTGQVQSPSFVNTPSVSMPTVDYAGLVNSNYNQQLAQHNSQQQMNPFMQALYGIGTAGITSLSDRRLKTDVSHIGMWRDLPIYLFRYVWGGPMQIGVMAQDMLRLRPAAVVRLPGGFLAVNYGAL